MARGRVFAANWKMHLGPAEARDYLATFLAGFEPDPAARYWFFPSAVSLEAVAVALNGHPNIAVGAQDVYWEPKGAFTGATSVGLAKAAGASIALIGHSERRHVFGETVPETARKLRAVLGNGLTPLLCVGETVADREAGTTLEVVLGQLHGALDGLVASDLAKVVVAYEPVWAIGTGKNAPPAAAAAVHSAIRTDLRGHGHPAPEVLYGGSVNLGNVGALLAESELDGVLVGGASLDPAGWRRLVSGTSPPGSKS